VDPEWENFNSNYLEYEEELKNLIEIYTNDKLTLKEKI
jgi:hypothetical protein